MALTEAAVLRNFTQIADALKYMHERRVMHRIPSRRTSSSRRSRRRAAQARDLGVGRYWSKTDMTHRPLAPRTTRRPRHPGRRRRRRLRFQERHVVTRMPAIRVAALCSPFYRETQLYLLGKRITSGTFDPLPGGFSALRELVDLLRVDVAARASAADAYERAVAAAG